MITPRKANVKAEASRHARRASESDRHQRNSWVAERRATAAEGPPQLGRLGAAVDYMYPSLVGVFRACKFAC
jgi:hypothetical protein